MKLLRSITTVSAYTMGSRILGFIRTMLMASFLGVGPVSDALIVAIRLPSVLRRIFAEGAFNAAFIPMFAGILATKGQEDARSFAEQILSILLFSLIFLVVAVELLMPQLVPIFLPGFSDSPERLDLVIRYTRMSFPFILFISLTALFSGILNSFERFAAAASSPMVGNAFIIVFALIFTSQGYFPGGTFAMAIVGCGLVQLFWVFVPLRSSGMYFRFIIPRMTPNVRKFFSKIGPAAGGSGVVQINILIGTMIASLLPAGGISYLEYAERLNQLPLSVIGTAMGTALLPMLSRQIQGNKKGEALVTQNHALEIAMLLVLPAAVGLICLAYPIVKVLYQRDAFGPIATLATSHVLIAYACGLPAYILIKIFSAIFFARRDIKTPLVIAGVAVVIDITLSLSLLGLLHHISIALATAFSAWVNAVLLGYCLWRRGFLHIDIQLKKFLIRILIASGLMALALRLGSLQLEGWLDGPLIQKIFALGILILAGLLTFGIFAWFTGALNIREFQRKYRTAES